MQLSNFSRIRDEISVVNESPNFSERERISLQKSRRTKIVAALILTASLAFVIIDSFGDRKLELLVSKFLEWVERHPYEGILAVIIVFVVATVLFVPGSLLTLGAGFAFGKAADSTLLGTFLASTAVFIGASLGSICSFLLGRYLLRDFVLTLAAGYPIFQAVDKALQGNGFKIIFLLRLSPLIPYNALDYISGVTAISLRTYTLAMVGILPGTIMYCFIGASASSLEDTKSSGNEISNIISMVLGVVFAFCGIYAASYYSKIELDRILQEEEEENHDENPTIRLNDQAID